MRRSSPLTVTLKHISRGPPISISTPSSPPHSRKNQSDGIKARPRGPIPRGPEGSPQPGPCGPRGLDQITAPPQSPGPRSLHQAGPGRQPWRLRLPGNAPPNENRRPRPRASATPAHSTLRSNPCPWSNLTCRFASARTPLDRAHLGDDGRPGSIWPAFSTSPRTSTDVVRATALEPEQQRATTPATRPSRNPAQPHSEKTLAAYTRQTRGDKCEPARQTKNTEPFEDWHQPCGARGSSGPPAADLRSRPSRPTPSTTR